jgi:hypothetical protein
MFLYSSLLGHHLFYEVLLAASTLHDLGIALERLTSTIVVHRGIATIARTAWPMFSESLRQSMLRTCVRDDEVLAMMMENRKTNGGDCDALFAMLRDPTVCQLSPEALEAHVTAVERLQHMLDSSHAAVAANLGNLASLQDWLVTIPTEYIDSLNQRRPESLVILAYYCVLLEKGSEYWFVGDLGRQLIKLIDDHLGPFWAQWLEWPKRMTRR